MISVNRFTLPNGLRVVHHQNSATAMVALNVLYNVGSSDEDPGHTGMADLFEDLWFGGAEHIPEFDKALEKAGGTNNAWTNCDFTNFYDILPAHNAETAFWLESDRMKALAFSDKALEVQRQVVCEEFKQVCLNQPYGDLYHHLDALAFEVHPYGHPVIGKELSHIEGVTQQMVRDFFHSHYAPNNAVLAVVGNITLDDVRRYAEKWFGPIPARDITPRTYQPEPPQTQPRRGYAYGRVPQTLIVKAYHMPGYADPDYPVCDLITDLLASGRTSRFYRRLVMESGLFTRADASVIGSEEPGLLLLMGSLKEGVDEALAEQALEAGALSLVAEPPSGYELERTLNLFESRQTFGSMNYVNLAANLAMCEMHGEEFDSIIPRYRRTSVADIVRVASEVIRPDNCTTVIYRPNDADTVA